MLVGAVRLSLILFVVWLLAVSASAQCPVMPAGTICLTQAQANVSAANVRELAAKDEKIKVLEDALKEKDKNTDEVKATAAKNEADLRDALHRTEIDLATKTGEIIQCDAAQVRATAIIDALLKNYKKANKFGLINIL